MQRQITYCDVCGKQTTEFYSDGDPLDAGYHITTKTQERCESGKQIDVSIRLDVEMRTSCGSSGKAGFLHGRDFCSEKCLAKSINNWLDNANVSLRVVEAENQ